eukprot:305740-Rhodomonas_salina.1
MMCRFKIDEEAQKDLTPGALVWAPCEPALAAPLQPAQAHPLQLAQGVHPIQPAQALSQPVQAPRAQYWPGEVVNWHNQQSTLGVASLYRRRRPKLADDNTALVRFLGQVVASCPDATAGTDLA